MKPALLSLPLPSALCLCFFSSSIISFTDLPAPNVEIIRGKSNFNSASDSGSLLYLAKSTLMSSCGFSELHSTCTYNFYSENFEVSKHNIDPNFEDPYEMRGKKMNDIDPNCWSETRTETILNMINILKKSYILVSTKKQVRG